MSLRMYCIDTSSLLRAWVDAYPADIFAGFWCDFQELIDAGRLIAPEEVRKELLKKEDDIANWAKRQNGLFVPFDSEQEAHLVVVMSDHELLVKNTRRRHAADPFVIALAKSEGIPVVTEEGNGSLDKPKIPNVCKAMGVECLTVLELMRRECWQY